MKTTVREQKDFLSLVKGMVKEQLKMETIKKLVDKWGNPDCIFIKGNEISVRVSHEYKYFNVYR